MIKIGQIFIIEGKGKYAFTGMSAGGCVKAKSYTKNANVQFTRKFNLEDSKVVITEEISQEIIEMVQDNHTLEMKVRNMFPTQKFIGNNGKVYSFIKFNRTRFVFKDEMGGEYDAPPGFVKEIL